MKRIFLSLFVLVFSACSIAANTKYDSNLQKWRAAGISNYRYSLFIGCFCAFTENMPLTIEVQNGNPVSIMYADGTPVPQDDPLYETFSRYATMDRLFSELKADLDGDADEVNVTYHADYGFPEQISIDQIKEAVDDELGLTVSNFEIIQ